MSKFLIGVCEDEKCVHDIVNNLLDRYANMRNIEYEVIPFFSGMELLEFTQEMDLLFLDIAMPGLDGIETARKLNVRGISYKIVLLTGKTEYLKEGYKVGAFRFVTKPIAEQEFFEAVDDVRACMLGREEITVYRDRIPYRVQQKDILYIASDRNQTIICTKSCSYRSEKSLKEWLTEMDDRVFVQCHRSYLVNLSKIDRMENELLYLYGEYKVPLSKRQRRKVEEAFMIFDTRYR